jgi:NADH-quinone oxidoreductase subunit A
VGEGQAGSPGRREATLGREEAATARLDTDFRRRRSRLDPRGTLLESYLPVLVFLGLGSVAALAFVTAGRFLGPRRPSSVKQSPYECGLPSDVQRGFRFGISFYLVAMLFILFDVEAIFLYPVALHLKAGGAFVLVETLIFVVLLAVAFVFVWRRGALEWK